MKVFRINQHSLGFKKSENRRLLTQKIFHENISKKNFFFNNIFAYNMFFCKFGSYTRKKSFCFLSKKPRSVFCKFKLARIAFRELAGFGCLNGVIKASW